MINLAILTLFAALAGTAALPDSGLQNVTEVLWSGPETGRAYLGSPSIVRCNNGSWLVTHDWFGPAIPSGPKKSAYAFRSDDSGATWTAAGVASPIYWATLFNRNGDDAVYLMGTTNDGNPGPTQVSIAKSEDCGSTWLTYVLTNSTISYSTGPTPILAHNGRLWRAFELNSGPGWGAGYAAVVFSAAADSNLVDAHSWTVSQPLPFADVAHLVPASWKSPALISNFGWLESNAVAPVSASDPGINVLLRVNSLPAANKAALLYLATPDSKPSMVDFIEFPGGMSKFTVRQDATTGLFVTLSNYVEDSRVTLPPVCGAVQTPIIKLPSCSMEQLKACASTAVTCLWAHANARNNLTLSVSRDQKTWTVVRTVMEPDTGDPEWVRQIFAGFQYVDWQFDGDDMVSAVRAAYRGADCYHNSNRILVQRLVQWRQWLPKGL